MGKVVKPSDLIRRRPSFTKVYEKVAENIIEKVSERLEKDESYVQDNIYHAEVKKEEVLVEDYPREGYGNSREAKIKPEMKLYIRHRFTETYYKKAVIQEDAETIQVFLILSEL